MKIGQESQRKNKTINNQIDKEKSGPVEKQEKYLSCKSHGQLCYLSPCYNYVGLSDNLDMAFDLLFEETMKTEKTHDGNN